MDIFIAIAIFLVSMLLVVILRKRIGQGFEIKNTDILIGIIPLAIWLILSGKISSFEYGDLKIVAAFQKASSNPISEEITDIYRQDVSESEKGSIAQLEYILKSKPDALTFYAGEHRYNEFATTEYLSVLSKSTLKYLLIKTTDKKFIGIISVEKFMSQTMAEEPSLPVKDFVNWLNNGKIDKIKDIPDLLSIEEAVSQKTSKQDALSKMQESNTRFLPVVQDEIFDGVIEMERLSTSLLMDISKTLNK